MSTFDWVFMGTGNLSVLFCLLLVVTPLGRVRLGGANARPDYSRSAWFAMLFAAGTGIGLMFFWVSEPVEHFLHPPLGLKVSDAAATRLGMAASIYHWGIHGWAMYAVVALSIAFASYNLGQYLAPIGPLSNWVGREDLHFMHGWTTFFWGWWISWSPFAGLFLARISRGRTVRELIASVLVVPTLIAAIWMNAFGGTAVSQYLDRGHPDVIAVPSRGKAARPWVDAEHYAIRITLDGRQLGGSAVITLTPRVAGIPVLPVTISHKLCIHTATLNDDLRVETWPDSTKILTRAFSDRTARMPMPQSCSLTRSSAVRPFSSGSTTRVGAVLQRPGRFLLCEGSGQLVSKLRDILRTSAFFMMLW